MALNMSIQLSDGTVERLAVQEHGPVVIGRDNGCHVVLINRLCRRHTLLPKSGLGFNSLISRTLMATFDGIGIGDSSGLLVQVVDPQTSSKH